VINENKIITEFSGWLKKREDDHQVLSNLKMLTNDYGTGWEHWLKYELSLSLIKSLPNNLTVEPERTALIDGRGLRGKTTKRADIAILSSNDEPIHFLELKCGWLTESEIDDWRNNNMKFTKKGEEFYLGDFYYLTKIKANEKIRRTFIFSLITDKTGESNSELISKEKVNRFLDELRTKLCEYAELDPKKVEQINCCIDGFFFLTGYSINIE
jgi:hypothetical protein